MVENLGDTVRGLCGHRRHDEDEGEHQHMCQDLDAVGDEGGESALRQLGRARVDDDRRANVVDGDDRGEDEEHHDGAVERDELFSVREVLAYVLRCRAELRGLVVLGHEGLHHADRRDVLLHGVVQGIVLLENTAEDREGDEHDGCQDDGEHRHHAEEDEGHLHVDAPRHDDREDDHEGHTHSDADEHAEGVLHVGDVRGHAGDQGGRREAVDVRKREVLHLKEEILAQVLRQAHRGGRREARGEDTAGKRGEGQPSQDQAQAHDGAQGYAVECIHKRDHGKRDQALEDHFPDDEQRGQDRGGLKLA